MRSLSPEEAELWARVTATIRPLSRELQAPETSSIRTAGTVNSPPPRTGKQVQHPPERSPRSAGTTLDGSWDKRLRTGRVDPDRTLDLHGHSLESAWQAIDEALERSIESGDRILLLITGHARAGEPPIARGKIRAVVNDWLQVSRHSASIAAVRPAHARHGGGGSLYLILRRR